MSEEISSAYSYVEMGGMFSSFDSKMHRYRETLAQANIVGHIKDLLKKGDVAGLAALGGEDANDPFKLMSAVTGNVVSGSGGNKPAGGGINQKA
jgi:hypothetical protein